MGTHYLHAAPTRCTACLRSRPRARRSVSPRCDEIPDSTAPVERRIQTARNLGSRNATSRTSTALSPAFSATAIGAPSATLSAPISSDPNGRRADRQRQRAHGPTAQLVCRGAQHDRALQRRERRLTQPAQRQQHQRDRVLSARRRSRPGTRSSARAEPEHHARTAARAATWRSPWHRPSSRCRLAALKPTQSNRVHLQ